MNQIPATRALCTGFAGTIGGEFTTRLLGEGWEVTGVDSNEWGVAAFPDHPRLTKKLGDFAYAKGKWDLIVHCAAYKHVDLIEANQEEALYNNYAKTARLLGQVQGKFLFISTDKAVEPVSFYGKTKKLGEEIARMHGGIVARLGNVMGSTGSVIPKWEAAIERGEPLPVTDPEMKRWMIPAEEAVAKVMALLEHAAPGDTIVPEMGAPKDLTDLIDETLKAKGYAPLGSLDGPQYKPGIRLIGKRPGERLEERLLWEQEQVIYTDQNGIIARK